MSGTRASIVLLFDIDATLLLTQGGGRGAMPRAWRAQFGVEDALSPTPFGGRTDTMILTGVLDRHDLELEDGARERYWSRVVDHMRVLMDPPRGGLLPGARELLDSM